MVFTSFDYAIFLALILAAYWALRVRSVQNVLLLVASYVFYGYIHPWFCILIAVSTVVDYCCGLGIQRFPRARGRFLIVSLLANLGMLGFFKYFNFFYDNVAAALGNVGLMTSPLALKIFLPVGISFYTFQTLSYTIDIYRGEMEPRRNFLDFALFVSFFPQLVAGPIERAKRFLPQIEQPRTWQAEMFFSAFPLMVRGYLKKLVIADNVAIFVDKIYMLDHPSFLLVLAGTIAFAVQIYTDFSAYTDIARATARLLGFDLVENFNSPYLAISPSDFWRRWHISFSTWIRDYLYIPLGGSRVNTRLGHLFVLVTSMGLSGLWHGAAWNFVLWGIYHGLLVFFYHLLGIGGRWQPRTRPGHVGAWAVMMCFTLFGWFLFRMPSLEWAVDVARHMTLGLSGDSLALAVTVTALIGMYSMPLYLLYWADKHLKGVQLVRAGVYGVIIAAIFVLARETQQDFIYFQF